MKLGARLIIIGILTYLFSFYTPWWVLFIITFSTCFFIHGSFLNTFIAGFLGVGLVWLGFSWFLDFQSESYFTEKIVLLFPVKDSSYLILISGLIGALSGGLGAILGNSFKLLFVKKKTKSYYR